MSWSNYFNLYLSCIQYIILKTLKNQIFQNNGCNIRHGDPDRYLYAVTTNQKFFKEKPLQRVEPCGPNYVSSIVLGDDREEWSNYKRNKGSLPRVETRTYSLLLHRQKSHASSTRKNHASCNRSVSTNPQQVMFARCMYRLSQVVKEFVMRLS